MFLYISSKHTKLRKAQVILVSRCRSGGGQRTCRTRGLFGKEICVPSLYLGYEHKTALKKERKKKTGGKSGSRQCAQEIWHPLCSSGPQGLGKVGEEMRTVKGFKCSPPQLHFHSAAKVLAVCPACSRGLHSKTHALASAFSIRMTLALAKNVTKQLTCWHISLNG